MGTFYTSCSIESVQDRTRSASVAKMLVDTGSEYTWVPAKMLESLGVARKKKDMAFHMANGQQITRSVGFAIVRCGNFFTVDEVVFAEDLLIFKAERAVVGRDDLKIVFAQAIP